MRTAEARLAPVSEVCKREIDVWQPKKETGTTTIDRINCLCIASIFDIQ